MRQDSAANATQIVTLDKAQIKHAAALLRQVEEGLRLALGPST